MRSAPQTELNNRLVTLARESEWFMQALTAARALGLSSWCIGAGAVRNLVWDALHEMKTPSALADVDMAYFDASDLSPERDKALQNKLTATLHNVPWEVTNQAAVHHWFEAYFGHAVPALTSLEEAVGSWPEFATSVGLRLEHDDAITVIAPYGLDDLFSLVIQRNPTRVSLQTYRERVMRKRYTERWPKVKVIAC
jgi:uncharacterized protein